MNKKIPDYTVNPQSKIYVSGHKGLVGSAIMRRLQQKSYHNLCFADSREVDLRDRSAVESFFAKHRPDCVILAAAKVGGIQANNTYPADFLFDNLCIQNNVIDVAYRSGASRLLFLGSSCIYPKFAPQPIQENILLTGALEPTNEWYAIAKIAGIKMVQAYRRQYGFNAISLMPSNIYGPNDYFNLNNSHVIPALLKKFHDAKTQSLDEVVVWGTGTPKREFLFVDDLAEATVFLMNHYNEEGIINVGTGNDLSINDLAILVGKVVGFTGRITYDTSKPDGTPRKVLDVRKINALGWQASTSLEQGLCTTYAWMLANDLRQ